MNSVSSLHSYMTISYHLLQWAKIVGYIWGSCRVFYTAHHTMATEPRRARAVKTVFQSSLAGGLSIVDLWCWSTLCQFQWGGGLLHRLAYVLLLPSGTVPTPSSVILSVTASLSFQSLIHSESKQLVFLGQSVIEGLLHANVGNAHEDWQSKHQQKSLGWRAIFEALKNPIDAKPRLDRWATINLDRFCLQSQSRTKMLVHAKR